MLLVLFFLLAGHIFVDFFLQLTRLTIHKRTKILVLAAHAFSWAFVLSLILLLTGFFALWKLGFLFVTHFLIDWLKIRFFKASLSKLHPVNITDQLLHLLTILLALHYS